MRPRPSTQPPHKSSRKKCGDGHSQRATPQTPMYFLLWEQSIDSPDVTFLQWEYPRPCDNHFPPHVISGKSTESGKLGLIQFKFSIQDVLKIGLTFVLSRRCVKFNLDFQIRMFESADPGLREVGELGQRFQGAKHDTPWRLLFVWPQD